MALTVRNAVVLAKIETTPGTDAVPTATADAILANAVSVAPQPNVIDSAEHSGSLDVGEPIVGITPMQCTIQLFAKGSGAAGTAPEYGPLLQACGMSETLVLSTSATYAPASVSLQAITLYIYRAGLRWIILGNRGTWSMTMTSGGLAVFDFTFTGRFAAKADVAVPAPTLDAVRPVAWKGGAFTIGGVAAAVRTFTIGLNNTVAIPDNPNHAEGFDVPEITQRDIQGSMDPLETLIATRNIFADFRAGTPRALSAVLGSTAGNILTVAVPVARYRNETQGDRDALLTVDVPFSAVSVDNGVSLVYT